MGNFNVNYNAGGTVDKVKNINNLDEVGNVDNIINLENVETLKKLESVDHLEQISNVTKVEEIGKIKGFATMTQPYNIMEMFDVPAMEQEFEFAMDLPATDVEILAISLTCSGYGEDDHYDLFFNDIRWFKDWYCSEVKEGLFLGTSTYVYAAPAGSTIKLVFKNDSGTSKKIWLGVRMLVGSLNNI